ncbi:type II secretion system minor pseudopilin GspK [Legionella taurinensis]|uniref:Type II secretion system protein K n=1 Tax=Legionella taurinensis TaxID=70611 RepID=A0A3A5L698_9GAMM|nr:type II secretion system minor pseudopilin GspK [Legionella taurinensis]RJT48400.1 general secretion pathway protein GspK [Legionella taurinensis]RJT68936.1 general secretion pathway protein GspK [Legionella taurinensis]STY26153.1 type II secretory pathway protein LspK [Legionella taurinensis]
MLRPKQAGSALISALFIMTLVAIAATAMSTRLQLDIYRTRLTLLSDQLYLASQSVTFWAMSELRDSKNTFTRNTAAGALRAFPDKQKAIYPPFTITGELYDLQSRFNLNNLSSKNYSLLFLKLLEKPDLKLSAGQRKQLLDATMQWITDYKPGRGNDEYLAYYTRQKPAYLPGYQPFESPSEFRLVRGVSANLYQGLADFISALPEPVPINLNTAPQLLLKGLGNGLTNAQVQQLLDARGETGIKNMNKIGPLLQKLGIRSEHVTLESQYFMSVARVTHEDLSLINYAILKRSKNNQGKITVSLIKESLNTL